MSPGRTPPRSLLLLGAGELGKEIAISAQRLGVRVIAVDRYENAPAMQVAHVSEAISMVDGKALERVIRTYAPDLVVPELEGVRSEVLLELEAEGFRVMPTAEAVHLSMSRERMRELAARELGLRTARYRYASSEEELRRACDELGYPCVVKSLVSTRGAGQSTVTGPARVGQAWAYAREDPEQTGERVIVEELVEFHTELTLLAVRTGDGSIHFMDPVASRQERGDYRESWMPAPVLDERFREAREMTRALVDRLGGAGLYAAEFFVAEDEVVFSEVCPRPHDTGMVTMVGQDLSQFDLHVRAVLGLPVPPVRTLGPSASAAILADRHGVVKGCRGLDRALQVEGTEVRIFGKPEARPFRRMGVALAYGASLEEARARALEAASRVTIDCG